MGIVVDLFAGGGGASVGVERALGRPVDLAVNHDLHAIRNHRLNHPRTTHRIEDIRDVVPSEATGGRPVDVLWASPDCRHFSRAKGGRPCHPEVRMLPWQIVRWAREVQPELVAMENVPEFLNWGPLHEHHDAEGCQGDEPCSRKGCDGARECKHGNCKPGCRYRRPIKDRQGETFAEWRAALQALGYSVEARKLKACDYGAPTSRLRLFVVCRRDGQPAVWPEPTHGPGLELPYRTAAECIDWSDLGSSIFTRKRPLADATHRRIARGLVKYVIEARRPFLVNTRNGERKGQAPRCLSIDEPMRTVTARGSQGALVAAWVAKHYGGVTGHGPSRPLGAITARDSHGLAAAYMTKFYGTCRAGAEVHGPVPTVTAGGNHMGLVAAFLAKYYGKSYAQGLDEPMGTLTTKDRYGLVTVQVEGEPYVITDVTLRMLQPPELKLAQGFPESYRLEGTQELQKRLIGNSVPPQLSEAVVRANAPRRALGPQLTMFAA